MAQFWRDIGMVLLLKRKSLYVKISMLKTVSKTENSRRGTLRASFSLPVCGGCCLFFRTEANEKRRFSIETRQNAIPAHSPAQV